MALRIYFGLFILIAIHFRVAGQCFADYNTYNNFCNLEELYLEAVPIGGTGPYTFLWETGETTQTIIIPLALGDYLVTVTDANGCTVTINCHIKPFPQVLYYPFNQNACEGDTVTLFLEWFRDSIPGATYQWSTGDTTPTIQITNDITWSVTVTDPATGCEYIIPPNLFDFHPTPYPEIIGPATLCAGQTATLSVDGGPFGTIIWYIDPFLFDPIYSTTLEIDAPGTYLVWGSSLEAGYCWHQDTLTILPGDINPPELDGPPILCNGQNGVIDILNSTEYNGFLWSNGQTTSSISVNQPGTYSVTVTNSGGCTETGTYTIASGSDYTLDGISEPAFCGESNGNIDLTVSPPGSYNFSWSNGATSEDLNDIPGGSYTVTVTSSMGCTSTETFLVPDDQMVLTISEIITPNSSCVDGNGAIDITIDPPGTYSWLWSNGATSEDLINIGAGTYSVTVTSGQTCTATAVYVVENILNAPEIAWIETPVICGQSNGTVDLDITGGEAPYTFIWSNGATSEDLNDISAGNYSVTVTGANGCSESATISVTDEEITITILADILPVTSCIESNGSIDLTILPAEIYTILWSNGATTEDIGNLSEGVYTVEVTFGISCVETATFSIEFDGNQIDVNAITGPNTACSDPNGYVDLTVTPDDIYTFAWSNGATSEDLQDLGPGIYSVTITNGDNCSSFGSYVVENSLQVPLLVSQISSASCGQSNGAIDLMLTPELGNTFQWSNGDTTEDLHDLASGSYSITVTSAYGCIVVDTLDVPDETSDFTMSAVILDNNSCTNPDGMIDLTITPGASSYTFLWSNGATAEDVQSLPPGSYSVTVTDSLSCSATADYTVGNNISTPLIDAVIIPATCGQNNGEIILSTIPSIGNTFAWSTGDTSSALTGITPGWYQVTVTGENGCSVYDTFEIQNTNSNFTIDATLSTNSSCINPNGAIDLTLTPPGSYSFVWSNGMTSEDIADLSPGSYAVTVTDSLNCVVSETYNIQSNTADPVISGTVMPETCGQTNGGIDLDVLPATGMTFLWSNGTTTEDLQNLQNGIYTVTVTASNGCNSTATFDVQSLGSVFTLSASVTTHNSCISANGSLDITVAPAGSYTFQWSNGATTEDLLNIAAGSYTVTVTDSLNCQISEVYIVEDSTEIPVVVEEVSPATCGKDNGAIILTVTPPGGNVFHWSNGSLNKDIVGLAPGMYSVTVTAENGCSAIRSFEVLNTAANFSLSVTADQNSSCVDPNGSIDLVVSPPGVYAFQWSNGLTTEDIQNLAQGIYHVTVTDVSDCALTASVIIEDSTSVPDVTYFLSPAKCGEDNGAIDLTVVPAGINSYMWSNGDTSEDLHALSSGTYSVTVTNSDGCTWSSEFNIEATPALEINLGAGLFADYGQALTLRAEVNLPVSAIDTTIWLPQGLFSCHERICLEQVITPVEETLITFIVFDTNGCLAEQSIMLFLKNDPQVFIPNVFSPNTDGSNDVFTVYANSDVTEIVDLRIFDRWGEFVFQNQHFPPNDPDYGWDGSYKNQMMEPQVFVYWTILRLRDGTDRLFKGDVTLLR